MDDTYSSDGSESYSNPTDYVSDTDDDGLSDRILEVINTKQFKSKNHSPSRIVIAPEPPNIQRRLRKIEEKQDLILKAIEELQKQQTATTKTVKKGKTEVPNCIRAAVRDAYTHEIGAGKQWELQRRRDGKIENLKTDSETNRELTAGIKLQVKGMYPDASDLVIKEATKRYFTTMLDKRMRFAKGKTGAHRQKMVGYQRRKRKLESRRGAVQKKTSWGTDKKRKVAEALCMELMSSEEEENSDGEDYILIKPLPWRSDSFNDVLQELDQKVKDCQSQKGKRQELKRVRSASAAPSSRKMTEDLPSWTVSQE